MTWLLEADEYLLIPANVVLEPHSLAAKLHISPPQVCIALLILLGHLIHIKVICS
jgi:hypothetical protein